ncbi:telomeric repeat-binding factor 2-interacting protein 1 isoform X1 [Oreochromis aureus]|uniref:telomeric repeat-binding factor 2-interacting protein 1 isoform X1 n=1 Tax=Oreochromis aureus TaxID=47969 RepID=UPI0012BD6D10|nr:telomeric repeat-binding factor 2-interacting protein 1 isoform X1 [Oreochromis aureus]XP_031587248.1 telomeric repeat-binding factor 2-interacting protein 1 isoform X1 [Oreochromis aureus]
MPSKREVVARPAFSPVLFMTVEGEPMNFFLRPGPIKRKLQPLISAGGGMLCNVQQPGAILLTDPEDRSVIPESTAHWYVSTQYIYDCAEKNEQLNLEDYRLNPEKVQRHSARLSNSKNSSPQVTGGRSAYTPEEDAAILNYVSKHKTGTGGNRLWQEMEKQHVTGHTWQSMKHRYKAQLAKKQTAAVEAEKPEGSKTAEEKTEVEEHQETDVQKSSCEEDVSETDLTQIDVQLVQTGSTPENVDQEEEQHVSQKTDKQQTESKQSETLEAEVSQSFQTVPPCADLQAETQLLTTDAERGEPQPLSPQKQSLSGDDSTPAQPEPTPKCSSSEKPKEKQKASPVLEQPSRRRTRRQLELEPYGKKLRSSSTQAVQTTSSPQPLKKTKSALQKDTTTDQPLPKKARGKTLRADVESDEEQSTPAAISKTIQADETDPVPQKGEKKKEKRKLGILELATKEFEDDSESDDLEAPDLQNPAQTAATSTSLHPPPADTTLDPGSKQSCTKPGPTETPLSNVEQAQATSNNCAAEKSCLPPAAEPVVSEAVGTTSKAHLFIFDSESQEDDPQSVIGERPAAPSEPQPTVNKDAAFSLTQDLLEEDKLRIRDLMNQTDKDLISVTKALLKTSGDVSAAKDLLLNPTSISGPFWNRCDDRLLLSAEPNGIQRLQEKYGEENVAKRIVFLEVEG